MVLAIWILPDFKAFVFRWGSLASLSDSDPSSVVVVIFMIGTFLWYFTTFSCTVSKMLVMASWKGK